MSGGSGMASVVVVVGAVVAGVEPVVGSVPLPVVAGGS